MTALSAPVGFPVMFVVTLGLLGAVVYTGLNAKRRAHITLVVFTVASLGITIFFAERLGTLYDLPSAGRIYGIHLFFAKTTVVAYALPVITGVMTLKNSRRRGLHATMAWTVIALTVTTAVTGWAMLYMANPL